VGLAALAPASIASATSLRGDGDGGAGEPSHQNLANSLWPFHSDDVKSGITFERTDTTCPLLPAEVTMWRLPSRLSHLLTSSIEYLLRPSLTLFIPAQFQIQSAPQPSPHATFDDGHCESSDSFGGNVCHYNWGDDITVKYDGRLGQQLDNDVYIEISLKIDNLVHHSQTCPICGDNPCTINLPALPKSEWSIQLPPCPLTPELLSGEWKGKLPNKSPVPRLLNGGSGTVVEGTVWLKKRNGHGDEGDVLMEIKGNVHLK